MANLDEFRVELKAKTRSLKAHVEKGEINTSTIELMCRVVILKESIEMIEEGKMIEEAPKDELY